MKHARYSNLLGWVVLGAFALTGTPALASGQWEVIDDSDGFITKRKEVAGSDVFAFRGETVVDVPLGKIMAIFSDTNQRKNWVDRFMDTKDLEVRGPNDKIYWISFDLPFPVSNRDYVLRAVASPDPANRVIVTKIRSVHHRSKGEDDCCVRAMAFGTYYRFEAIPGTQKTRLEVEVHTDPKGILPSWLVNMIQKKWPYKTLTGLARVAKKAKSLHPTYANWHDADFPQQLLTRESKEEPAKAATAE